jgi:hypothetical protein
MDVFVEWFAGNVFKNVLATLALLITIVGMILVVYRRYVTRQNLKDIGVAFKDTVAGLSSPSNEVRMSSAILLRRFLDPKSEVGVGGTPFATATVSVIAGVLKTLQTSELQKVLSDSLRFAPSGFLKGGDFQRANLSKAFLGGNNVDMQGADFFQANLSGALLKEAVLNNAEFYEATLDNTRFPKAQLRGARFTAAVLQEVDFRGADLRGASFDKARLRDVDFTGAKLEGVSGVNAVGVNVIGGPACIQILDCPRCSPRKVFVSRLGVLDARQRLYVDSVKDIVTHLGAHSLELSRDMYDASNVLSNLSEKIASCTAMIAFGFRSIHIVDGVYRYSTEDARAVKNEFISTPWNHLEVGMALMKRMPVLLLADEGIADGVFHNNVNDELIVRLPIGTCLDSSGTNIKSWMQSVLGPENEPTTPPTVQ